MYPRGLWYSVDCDWERRRNDKRYWHGHPREFKYELVLDTDIRLLVIDTIAAVLMAEEKWGDTEPDSLTRVNWSQIADEYDGFEANPWVDTEDLDAPWSSWYGALNASSGCLWNNKAQLVQITSDPCVNTI